MSSLKLLDAPLSNHILLSDPFLVAEGRPTVRLGLLQEGPGFCKIRLFLEGVASRLQGQGFLQGLLSEGSSNARFLEIQRSRDYSCKSELMQTRGPKSPHFNALMKLIPDGKRLTTVQTIEQQ